MECLINRSCWEWILFLSQVCLLLTDAVHEARYGNKIYSFEQLVLSCMKTYSSLQKNTIKAGGSTVRAQNVDWVMDGWSG